MKIKLAILEKDKSYIDRIVAVFETKYADKFEVYSFTNAEIALATIKDTKINVFVAGDTFEIDFTKLPSYCGFAYLVDSADIDSFNNQQAICKFQKVDLIYKQILSVFSEHAGGITSIKTDDENCRVIAFGSPSGGVGSSTMAAACAIHFAKAGKKTLYLNLENFGSSDVFFTAEGQYDMSDIIFALKSKKANLPLKLESCVKCDKHGVYFYSQPKVALDMMELGTEEILRLISELRLAGSYDVIVLDMQFGLDKSRLDIYKKCNSIIMIGDGSENSNAKLYRAVNALNIMEQGADMQLSSRMLLLYNKFSNKTSKAIEDIGIKNIGGAPRYEHAENEQILSQLSSMAMFDRTL